MSEYSPVQPQVSLSMALEKAEVARVAAMRRVEANFILRSKKVSKGWGLELETREKGEKRVDG